MKAIREAGRTPVQRNTFYEPIKVWEDATTTDEVEPPTASCRCRISRRTRIVAAGILPAVEPWLPALRMKPHTEPNRSELSRVAKNLCAHSGRRDARPLRQARCPPLQRRTRAVAGGKGGPERNLCRPALFPNLQPRRCDSGARLCEPQHYRSAKRLRYFLPLLSGETAAGRSPALRQFRPVFTPAVLAHRRGRSRRSRRPRRTGAEALLPRDFSKPPAPSVPGLRPSD